MYGLRSKYVPRKFHHQVGGEIHQNMYSVEPTTPGLCAYWKFNEGEGDKAIDQTGNGNDAIAHSKVMWPDGIEVTQKNKE